MGDGWFPLFPPDDEGRALIEDMREQTSAAGRDPDSIGIESWVSLGRGTPDDWAAVVESWRELGATHISVNTMNAGLSSPAEHIDAIRRFREEVVSG